MYYLSSASAELAPCSLSSLAHHLTYLARNDAQCSGAEAPYLVSTAIVIYMVGRALNPAAGGGLEKKRV